MTEEDENPFSEPVEIEITDSLDLHSFSPKDIRAVVEAYLAEAHKKGFSVVRIIHGKLKPGTWDSYERAYKEAIAKAGKIPGLKGRWLAHADDDPDAGYTISLWENDAAMRT